MGKTSLSIRPAVEDDCELLFSWVNDPQSRRMSFSGNPVPREEHERWFERKLRDADCLLYIVTGADDEPVGQVRFDVDEERNAVISVAIAPRRRGEGLSAAAIRLATAAAALPVVHAYIRPENEASIRAFAKAGFRPPERVTYQGVTAFRMSHE